MDEGAKELVENLVQVQQSRVTLLCVNLCGTAQKDYLELDDKLCLINCGYNWNYLQDQYIQLQKSLL